jgi:uncharacterized membrane protein
MYGRDAGHTADAGLFSRKLTEPMLGWSTPSSIESHGMAVGNFTGNIRLNQTAGYDRRTLHCAFAENGLVEIVEASTGRTMWQAPLGGTLLGVPALSDFNDDGRLELVVTSSAGNITCYEPQIEWNGTTYSWNATGIAAQRLWERALGAEATYSSPVLGDVSGDGVDDVVLCAGRNLYVLDGLDGSTVWNATLPGNLATSPVLVKYGTAGLWVAVQSFNTTIVLLEKTYFTLFNEKGQESWTKSVSLSTVLPTTVVSLPSPAAADLNGDGFTEMVFVSPFESGNGRLYCYKQDGSALWSAVQLKGQCEATPAIGDLNADGVPQVVTSSWNFTLTGNARVTVSAVDGRNGTVDWTAVIDKYIDFYTERSAAGPALADLNADANTDIVLALWNGRVLGLDGPTGDELWEYNTSRVSVVSSPSVADVEGQGFPAVFIDGLALKQRIADLALGSGDISFSNDNPSEGDTVSISAFIHNNGTKSVTNATVRFSDIYDNTTVWTADKLVDVQAGGSAGATVSWTAGGGGRHVILVAADPDGTIDEISKSNNQASRDIPVFSHYTLSVWSSQNESYVNAGDEAVYLVNVHNEGDSPNTVNITLWDVSSGWTASASTGQLQLESGKTSAVTVRVRSPQGAGAGAYPVNLTARSEISTANRATITLTTRVRGLFGVEVAPSSYARNVMADNLAIYVFNVTNTGNDADTIVLGNSTPPADWLVFLSTSSVDLAGMARAELTVVVRPPPYAVEGDYASVDITATSSGDPSAKATATTRTTVVLPDLAVLGASFRRADGVEADGTRIHLVDGGNATIDATVRNTRDNVDVGAVDVTFEEGGIQFDSGRIGYLVAGQNGTVDVPWKPAQGQHTITTTVDPSNTVRETDENNNNLTSTTYVKTRITTASYVVSGTVTRRDGSPVAGATVVLANIRTGRSMSLGTDGNGRYSGDISTMPDGYQEEERMTVTASDGLTTCSTGFFAYSEDGGKVVDLALLPGPHDVFLAANRTSASTDPLVPAAYRLWVTNLGSNANLVMVNYSTLPSQWVASLENSSGVRNSVLALEPNATDYLTFKLTPPQTAPAGSQAQVRLLAVSENDSSARSFVDTATSVNQLFSVELSFENGQPLKPGGTGRYNFTVRNTGNGNDTFDLSAGAPQGLGAVLNRTAVALGAFSEAKSSVDVTAAENLTPAAYNISIAAASRNSPSGASARGNIPVAVEAFRYGIALFGGIGALQQEDFGVVNFSVRNTGDIADRFSLSATPREPGNLSAEWSFGIRQNGAPAFSVSLDPGAIAALQLRIEAPREISGIPQLTFDVSAASAGDPSQTATTMLSLSIERPDLYFLGSVKMSPAEPSDGQKVRITVNVQNQGHWDSPPLTVRFFIDSKTIGETTSPAVVVNGMAEVSFNWTAKEGTHAVKASVNPDGAVKELVYGNNDITRNVVVKAGAPQIEWGLIIGFIAVVAVVAGVYLYMTRRSRGRGGDDEEEEYSDEEGEAEEGGEEEAGEEGSDGDEASGEEEESEETRGGEEEEGAGEEEANEEGSGEDTPGEEAESEEEGAGTGDEVEQVEAVEVVEEEPPLPKKLALKKRLLQKKVVVKKDLPQKTVKPKRPPQMEEQEVAMPRMMRIG